MRRHTLTLLGLLSLLAPVAVGAPALAGQGGKQRPAGRELGRVSSALSGAQVPGGGDGDGRGRAHLELRPGQGSVCFAIRWQGVDGVVTAAHIHEGARGAVGPHHIDLFNDESFVGRRNTVAACVQVEDGGHGSAATGEKLRAVIENPGDYYLNVHSSAFPDGAIRGQLGR